MGKKLRQDRRKTERDKDMTEVRQKKRIREIEKNREVEKMKKRKKKERKKERNTNIIKQIRIETEEKVREKGIAKKRVNRRKT
jgi:hypothetical protein